MTPLLLFVATLFLVGVDDSLSAGWWSGYNSNRIWSTPASLARSRTMGVPRQLERIFNYVPFDIRVSMNVVEGFRDNILVGTNPAINPGSREDLIPIGGEYVWPTAAESLELVSDDAADNPAGAGCSSVEINGLLADFTLSPIIADLDGLTPIITPEKFFRVNGVRGVSAGGAADPTGANSNIGTITAMQETSGIVMCNIPPDTGRSRWGVHTVPADSTWIIDRFIASISRMMGAGPNAASAVTVWTRVSGGIWVEQRTLFPHSEGSSDIDIKLDPPLVVLERTDVRFSGVASASNVVLAGVIGGLIFDDSKFRFGN